MIGIVFWFKDVVLVFFMKESWNKDLVIFVPIEIFSFQEVIFSDLHALTHASVIIMSGYISNPKYLKWNYKIFTVKNFRNIVPDRESSVMLFFYDRYCFSYSLSICSSRLGFFDTFNISPIL
jgi:hypothetical protein